MDLIEDIGPILGIAAFLGFAILALLIVLQAREVRRLREWAGRAPERALEADDASRAVLDARGETSAEETPGFFERARARLDGTLGPGWEELNRRSPANPAIIAALLAALIAAGVVTSGFGLIGGNEASDPPDGQPGGGSPGGAPQTSDAVEVAVLNATQVDDPLAPVSGVQGLANVIAEAVIEPAGFKTGTRSNAPAGVEATVIMYEPGAEADATELQAAAEPELGAVETIPITPEVADVAKDAPLVLLIGLDDAEFGQDASTATP